MYLGRRADHANTTILPKPAYALAPSGKWDGNDGNWSTFIINAGDVDGTGHGQNFRVLISTSSSVTQLPMQADWCSDRDCAQKRGLEIFESRQPLGLQADSSRGWTQDGLYNQPLPYWWSGRNLNGTYGWINIGLGPSSPSSSVLEKQIVVGNAQQEFFMGSFGLGIGAVKTAGEAQSPFLDNFAYNNQTPSRSFGYTAGAFYRNRGTPGNLVLGGYDRSRIGGGISIPMVSNQNYTLLVGVQSVEYHPDRDVDANDFSLTSDTPAFLAAIDSTLPYLWLPDALCDQFADKFQLQYDDRRNMYTVNQSAINYNRQQNATVTFKIGANQKASNDVTTITLPYSAFDLLASDPIFPNRTRYFPIKKSPNGIYVLGRAFLQETYLIVDYERANFTIAPALFSDPLPQPEIISIFSKDYKPPGSDPAASNNDSGNSSLPPGAIAGIVVGVVVLLVLLGIIAFFLWKRRREAKQRAHYAKQFPPYHQHDHSDIDTTAAGEQIKHRRVSELESDTPGSPPLSTRGYYGMGEGKDRPGGFPPINEMESPPAELWSPPPQTDSVAATPGSENVAAGGDYFVAGVRMRKRAAAGGSSGAGTPSAVPLAELPGEDAKFSELPAGEGKVGEKAARDALVVDGVMHPALSSSIADTDADAPTTAPVPAPPTHTRGPSEVSLTSNIDEVISGHQHQQQEDITDAKEETDQDDLPRQHPPIERRPSHTRGLSDTTVQSDSTAVSQPTPEELERWARSPAEEPRRPLSE
ncbi:acid protease [Westerdykella ornata]|uniref:Acid protease n=1 Tax=Westerdykella ornata TaxID=318751 RepID=A0A6A6JY46_WESOR|nr:acid protease [Westerdykella ornata]KAF2281134.1 acid protease [Westerdykella ornata]